MAHGVDELHRVKESTAPLLAGYDGDPPRRGEQERVHQRFGRVSKPLVLRKTGSTRLSSW